jgi:hypothetical protein
MLRVIMATPAAKLESEPRLTARAKVRTKAQLTLPKKSGEHEADDDIKAGRGTVHESAEQATFRKVITKAFVPDLAASDRPFLPGLRVKGVTARSAPPEEISTCRRR